MPVSRGLDSRGYVGSALPITSSNGGAFDFESETLALDETLTNFTCLRGTVAHAAARTRPTRQEVRGQIRLTPTPQEVKLWGPYIWGSAYASGGFTLAEALPSGNVQFNRGGTFLFTYPNVQVNRATFAGRPGQAMDLTLELLGTTETQGAVSGAPAVALDEHLPFVFSDLVLIVNGTTIDCMSLEVTFDNSLIQRFPNSLTATQVYRTDRICSFRAQVPYGDGSALYGVPFTGVAVTAGFSYGTGSATGTLNFVMPAVQIRKQAPPVNGREEIMLELDGVARYAVAANDEVSVQLATPA